ncbi:MAG: hypothetical protein V4607_17155 [Pseudomonadota bacterium]
MASKGKAWLLLGALSPSAAQAHSFGKLYNLPVPLWMYVYGAAAALLLSFLIVGYFLQAPKHSDAPASGGDLTQSKFMRVLRRIKLLSALKLFSVFMLGLCIVTGLLGSQDPYRNINMTFFWVIFMLGFSYITALIGDLYSAINPWRVIAETMGRVFKNYTRGLWAYPASLAYWPAMILYAGFIWIELFMFNRPSSLAKMLMIYSAINLLGVWLVGTQAWFRYCEFLSVFLRLTAKMAPLHYQEGKLRWRLPFAGLVEERAEHWSLLIFILFMLSSTAFDGLHATAAWFKLFWMDPYGLLEPWVGKVPIASYAIVRPYYVAYETLWLLLSPFLYLAFYLLFIALAKLVTRSKLSVHELALSFAFSLLPIALVYNMTHYYTLLLTQGVQIISLLSDPFGFGWNLFGTAGLYRAPILPAMGLVWHSQVGLILFGHIVSVYLAHLEALRVFPTRRQAVISQIPMLFLMVVFTAVGLWILAQPITAGR